MTAPRISKIHLGSNASLFGIGHGRPSISWSFERDDSTVDDFRQDAYQLRVRRGSSVAEYEIDSSDNIEQAWPLKEADLRSRERGKVAVRSRSDRGVWTEWSEQAFEVALLEPSDWSASFVTLTEKQPEHAPKRPFYTRTSFSLDATALKKIKEEGGRIYATALGLYHVELNGHRVGEHCLAPGWQSYSHRLHYQTYEVDPEFFVQGENVIGGVIGEGWYAGRMSEGYVRRNIWGQDIALQLQLEYPGGKVITDESWTGSYGPLLGSEIYDGETFDIGLVDKAWSTAHSTSWQGKPMRRLSSPSSRLLVAPQTPPIRRTLEISPVDVITTPKGKKILDFGQNFSGWVKIKHIPAKTSANRFSPFIQIRHAEVLDHGEIGMRPLRSAKATDTIYFGPEAYENWEPFLTFHGFRYAEVTGIDVEADNFVGVVIHSDMTPTSSFSCSHNGLNRLYQNVQWGWRGNTVGLPTDCPQRDERLGWTGDIAVFAPTGCSLTQSDGFLADWLLSVRDETLKDNGGVPPLVVPDVLTPGPDTQGPAHAVWGDAVILAPYAMYQAYRNTRILEEMYPAMLSWLEKGVSRGDNGLWLPGGRQLGDWLDPVAPPEDAGRTSTDPYLVADAYLVNSTKLMANIAKVIGKDEDHKRYAQAAEDLRKAFHKEYISDNGRLVCDSQTAYALSLRWGLLDPEHVPHAVDRLVKLLQRNEYKIGTGFAGTSHVLQSLVENGRSEDAFKLLLQPTCPSWLYPLSMGATTMWERWDSLLPNGDINPGEMTSFNHYAFGSVANFLHNEIGGLTATSSGYKTMRFQPVIGGDIAHAKVEQMTPYGRASCHWRIEGEIFVMDIEIPPNTSGEVVMPGSAAEKLGSGKYTREQKIQGTFK